MPLLVGVSAAHATVGSRLNVITNASSSANSRWALLLFMLFSSLCIFSISKRRSVIKGIRAALAAAFFAELKNEVGGRGRQTPPALWERTRRMPLSV